MQIKLFTTTTYTINSIMCFQLDDDDMESSKRRSIFYIAYIYSKCFTKPFIIRNLRSYFENIYEDGKETGPLPREGSVCGYIFSFFFFD